MSLRLPWCASVKPLSAPRGGIDCDLGAVRPNGCSYDLLQLPCRSPVRRLSALLNDWTATLSGLYGMGLIREWGGIGQRG